MEKTKALLEACEQRLRAHCEVNSLIKAGIMSKKDAKKALRMVDDEYKAIALGWTERLPTGQTVQEDGEDVRYEVVQTTNLKTPWPCADVKECKMVCTFELFKMGVASMKAAVMTKTLFVEGWVELDDRTRGHPGGAGQAKRGYVDWAFVDGTGLR
jgi:hypothetical protein